MNEHERHTLDWIASFPNWCALSARWTYEAARDLERQGLVEHQCGRPYAFRLTEAGREALSLTP